MKNGQPFSPFGLFTGIFIPEALCQSIELSAGAKLLFGSLCRYAGQDGRCFPFVKTLGTSVGLKERQTQYLLAELESIGLIRRIQRTAKHGDRTSNGFEFLWHPMLEKSAALHHPVQDSAPPPAEDCTTPAQNTVASIIESGSYQQGFIPKRVLEENQLNTHIKRVSPPLVSDLNGQTSQRWEEFWGKYPRKQRRDFAARNFLSYVTIETDALVFACLDRYLRSAEVFRGVVMNPDRWLYEQHCNGWQGDWPARKKTIDEIIEEMPDA